MTLTALVVTTAIIILGIYDLVAVSFSPANVKYSISRYLQGLGKYPFIVFTFGWIGGHVWGAMTPPPCPSCPAATITVPEAAEPNQPPGLKEE